LPRCLTIPGITAGLLLTPENTDSAALLMKHMGQRYVQYVSLAYGRSGTLWQGRFRSCLTQTEDYVLACYRHIERNPVRVDMGRHARQYNWSSYRASAEGRPDLLITPHEQYRRPGRAWTRRRDAYRALFKSPADEQQLDQIRQETTQTSEARQEAQAQRS
jgi:putative transposase